MDREKPNGDSKDHGVRSLDAVPNPHPRLPDPPRESRAIIWAVVLTLVVLVAATVWWYTHGKGALAGKSGPSTQPSAVPVIATEAVNGNMSIYLDGLGSVTALNTVTLRTRVDGQLIKVLYTEGQEVKEGQLLAQIDSAPFEAQLHQAQGQLEKDQALLKNAQQDLERFNSISKEAITQQQIDAQVALVRQDEGAVKADQAQIESANLQISYCQITAPITGRIGLRAVDQGNIVHASDATGLAVITQLQPIALIFNLPEDNLQQVLRQLNNGKKLTVEAWDRAVRRRLDTGQLLTIDNQIDPTTATFRLKAQFSNEKRTLFPNQFVNARLLINVKEGIVLVPSAAVQHSPQTTFVYAVKKDQTVQMVNVVTGSVENDLTEISSGLSAGMLVVTDGVDKLQPGAMVKVQQANNPATMPSPGDEGVTRPTRTRNSTRPSQTDLAQ